jgi:hypothetical protein
LRDACIQHIKPFGSRLRNIDNATAGKRAPIIDLNLNLLAVDHVGNGYNGSERQIGMSRRKLIRVKKFA